MEFYSQGQEAGRTAQREPSDQGGSWAEAMEFLADRSVDTVVEWTLEKIIEPLSSTFAGMITVLITAVRMPGDVPLGPLPDDFRRQLRQDDAADDPRYVATCLRADHAMVAGGVTNAGTWGGPARADIGEAISDLTAHPHPEAFVTRCSLQSNTCGVVWVAQAA